MLQDLLMPNENTDELLTKNLGSRKEELILLIEDSIKKGFSQQDGSKFKNRMLDFAANIFEKKISNEEELLTFMNKILKELNKERIIDSGEVAMMSFILGAATSIMWTKIHNR